jgi:hypothetical protein
MELKPARFGIAGELKALFLRNTTVEPKVIWTVKSHGYPRLRNYTKQPEFI